MFCTRRYLLGGRRFISTSHRNASAAAAFRNLVSSGFMDERSLPEPLRNLGSHCFTERVARNYLDDDNYEAYCELVTRGRELNQSERNAIAKALQMWSMELGAVNYAHWFSALRGNNAEKHDAFIDMNYATGDIKIAFSGEKLFKGETDGSSFPHGGLRDTSTAAAYLSWDTSSPPIVRGDTLYVPSVFVTWHGMAQDFKSPLLRSQDAISRESVRLLRLLNKDDDVSRVMSQVGWEQEFFVVDRESYLSRLDLMSCGRTLLGAPPHRGQQTDANYFGAVPLRIKAFLKDVQSEMWRLGISMNVLHNEVAPAQHEVSPIFRMTSRAADQNTLCCDALSEAAIRHNLVVLLHEKPFKGINGSGKHNNWGLATDTGVNIFKPGKTAHDAARFFAFVAALTRTLNVHGDVLRLSVASAGNDHRLGMHEAPPAIMSLGTGYGMEEHIDKIIDGGPLEGYGRDVKMLDVRTPFVQKIEAGFEDRNRTAPFPFCGNRFEFRAVGSEANIAWPMALLNTAVAESVKILADEIESGVDVRDAVANMFKEHRLAIYNGDNYSETWKEEAQKRKLWCLNTSVEAYSELISEKNVSLFSTMGVLTEEELRAHRVVNLEKYVQKINIEMSTMLEMVYTGVIPALMEDLDEVSDLQESLEDDDTTRIFEMKRNLYTSVFRLATKLKKVSDDAPSGEDVTVAAEYCRDSVLGAMNELREVVDESEKVCDHAKWPFAKYDHMLFSHHHENVDNSRN